MLRNLGQTQANLLLSNVEIFTFKISQKFGGDTCTLITYFRNVSRLPDFTRLLVTVSV